MNLDEKVSLHTSMKVCMKKMMYIKNHKIAGMISSTEEFMSHDELVVWVKNRSVDNGYIVVTARSKKKGDIVMKVWLVCDRSGEHKTIATRRRSGSKEIGCPF
ncbi:hypothetical protein R6Q59_022772 [Mikania micrantha]